MRLRVGINRRTSETLSTSSLCQAGRLKRAKTRVSAAMVEGYIGRWCIRRVWH